jgi:predicted MFS family arabinose efflux permease
VPRAPYTRPAVSHESRVARPLVALFVAEVVSTTGSEMAAVALPWFVLVTTGSPARMGFVMAAEFAGMTLLGVPSGRVATALGARQALLISDLARAALVLVIPVLHWAGALSFPVLVTVAFAVGAFFPAYSSSQLVVIADLLGDDELRMTRVGGLFGSVNETASFVGPALGGLLVALIGPVQVLVVDAGSFLVAFGLVGLFVPRAARQEEGDVGRSALDGLRFIARNRPLRRRVAGLAVQEVGFTALLATLPMAALHRYGGSARLAGWLLASYGAGSVVGGLLSSRARRVGDRFASFAIVGLAVSTWPLVAPLPAWAVAVAVAANGVFAGLFFPRFFSSLTVRTPAALRARVTASVTTVISAAGPLGFVGAGLLLHRSASVTPGFVLVAAAATLGAVIVASAGAEASTPAPTAPEAGGGKLA